jgi:hypothetical protein
MGEEQGQILTVGITKSTHSKWAAADQSARLPTVKRVERENFALYGAWRPDELARQWASRSRLGRFGCADARSRSCTMEMVLDGRIGGRLGDLCCA